MSGFITNRRRVLGGLALGLAMPALITSARAAQPIDAAADFGLDGNDQSDQSANGVEDTVGGNVRGRAALPETMSGATT